MPSIYPLLLFLAGREVLRREKQREFPTSLCKLESQSIVICIFPLNNAQGGTNIALNQQRRPWKEILPDNLTWQMGTNEGKRRNG